MGENDSNILTQQNAIKYIPTESEKKLLDVLLSPEHRMKSIKELCLIVGINRATYYRAFEKPEFKALYKSMSKELVDQSIAPVLNTFVREALRGSFQHGKVILEMAGLYSEKSIIDVNTEFNMNLTVDDRRARLIDILSRRQLPSIIDVESQPAEDGPEDAD
jgi:DNA-binding transcriptional regulator YhcF (GntR family)